MHVAEDIGFDKFDILSQRGLGHIEESVRSHRKKKRHKGRHTQHSHLKR